MCKFWWKTKRQNKIAPLNILSTSSYSFTSLVPIRKNSLVCPSMEELIRDPTSIVLVRQKSNE